MKFYLVFLLLSAISASCLSQSDTRILNPSFAQKLQSLLKHEVPELSCEQLFKNQSKYLILDTRNEEEFSTSHLEDAVWVGYSSFKRSQLENIDRNQMIVCYCSVGYRSEIIGMKLHEAGFTNVFNLYGGIFEWINRNYPVYTEGCTPVKKIHTYNYNWSKWIDNPLFTKTY